MTITADLDDLTAAEFLLMLALNRKTGRLTVKSEEGRVKVAFREGAIVYAASTGVREAGPRGWARGLRGARPAADVRFTVQTAGEERRDVRPGQSHRRFRQLGRPRSFLADAGVGC